VIQCTHQYNSFKKADISFAINVMKKLIFTILALIFLATPAGVLAEDQQIICPQPYGGGVVCGIRTHASVNTGLGDNLAVVGGILLVSSLVFLFLSKRFNSETRIKQTMSYSIDKS
jgi:hypothetical protein